MDRQIDREREKLRYKKKEVERYVGRQIKRLIDRGGRKKEKRYPSDSSVRRGGGRMRGEGEGINGVGEQGGEGKEGGGGLMGPRSNNFLADRRTPARCA